MRETSAWVSVLVIALGTVLLLAVSWRSFAHSRSHGVFRFFAAEAVLGLVVLNAPVWFRQPGAPAQLLSWALLAVSLVLAVQGFYLLQRLGGPATPAPGSPLFRIENTRALVTVGAYRYIRHPLYASGLFLAWGATLKAPSPLAILLALVATGFLVLTARAEETENLARFGEAYRAYMARTRLFIPFIW